MAEREEDDFTYGKEHSIRSKWIGTGTDKETRMKMVDSILCPFAPY